MPAPGRVDMAPRNTGAVADPTRFLDRLRVGLERCSITSSSRVLVAFSGGADSTALLLGLREIGAIDRGFKIEAAHFNHMLRGERSDADARRCEELCDQFGITFHPGFGDARSHAAEAGMSVEAAARDLRYRFLAEMAGEHDCDGVVTAHTMNDQAETVLLAVARGAGLRGVSGMAYVTERSDLRGKNGPLLVLRPLLGHRREETERFCAASGVTPLEDESNRDLKYARNRIRHRVLPELEKVSPGVVEAISRLAEIAASDTALIDDLAAVELRDAACDAYGGLSKARLREMPGALRAHVLAAAYRDVAGTADALEKAMLDSISKEAVRLDSGSIDLPAGVKLVIEHEVVRFLAGDGDPACPYPQTVDGHMLPVPGRVIFADGSMLSSTLVPPGQFLPPTSRWQAVVDVAAAGTGGFEVRARQDGDRFQPLGMSSEMKLQDFFVNQHMPARWRDRVPLVLGRGRICWVTGDRIADWAKVPEGAEQAVLLEFAGAPA